MRQHSPLLILLACCFLLATGLQAQTPVAHYDFSGSAKDISSYANNASINGARLVQDRFGWTNSAMYFDGEQGAVTAPNATQLNSPNATISFWINPTEFPGQGEAYILSFGGWQQRWKISLPPHGKPVFTTHAGGACCSDMDSGTPLIVGSWTHVVMVHDGAKDIIYFNGAKVNEKAVTGALDATTYPLGIGYDPIDNANYFNGVLDEVMLFSQALSDSEVAALYTQQNAEPVVAQGVVAAYSFDGNGRDGSDFRNHLSLTAGTLATDRFGYGTSALLCDGTSTEITAPNGAQLNSDYTTVSFWVKPNSLPGNGEMFLLSFGGWQERWKISLPAHGKPVWTTNNTSIISDMDSGDGHELAIGAWTHVVMVHDGTNDKIFMNGAMVAQKSVSGTLNSSTHPLGIGYNPIDGGSWFDGELDEVTIYNYALSDMDISDLYTAQSAFPGTPTSLVAHYSLNGDGKDETQFHNHARLADGATATANRHGWGSNALAGAATADNSPALQSDYTTISFWVYPNSFPGSGEVFLLSNGGWQERWKISLPAHGKPVFTTHSGGACCSDMDSGTPLGLNAWTHVVMVHDGTKDKIFINGALANQKDTPGALDKTKYPLGIGYDPIDNGSFFDGALDDVQIYNVALSDLEVAALYDEQSPAPNVPGSLVADYAFSGNSRDETPYNNHASAAVLGKDRFDKANQAAAFDGLSTEVSAANSPQLNSPFTTISFWVNPNSLPGSGEAYLLSFGGWQERWKISLPAHGKPVFTTHSGGACCSDMDSGDGNELVVGTWTHVAMVHDGAKDKIYMNGAPVAEKDVTGNLDNATYPFGIGYNPIDGGNWFDGGLDEVQIYNSALSDAEIAQLYADQSQPPAGGDEEAPDAPLNLSAEVTFNNVGLSWLPASDDVGVTAYNVYIDGAIAATTASTDAYFEGLTPLTEFTFAVTAIDDAGNESLPTSLRVTTGPDETPDVTPPTIPGNLTGSPSFNSVLISWDASTDDTQVAGYIIWVDGEVYDTVPASTLSVLVTGLDPQTLYTFEVAAFDLANNLSEVAELTIGTTEPLETDEPGLVAHYPFDGNANDATPYQNHGVIGGNPIFEPSTHAHGAGMDIKFDGMQDSVLAPNAVQLLSDYTTVSFWIRVDGQNIMDAEAYVLDFGHWNQRWKISLPQHLKIVWTTNSNNAQFPNFISDMDSGDGNEMVIGFWWYVTMVHDGENDIIYVNGVQANQKPALGKLNTTARPLAFGNNPIEGGQYFMGALDNVKIYNKALTAEEAARLFETGTTGTKEQNLVGAYIDRAFPNPATEMLTVNHRLPAKQPLLLRVFDVQGRQLDAVRLNANEVAAGQFTLDVSAYPQGIYSLNFVLGGKDIGSLKFTKQ
ncbi:MAG: fibronectin type III domain-containing protein [Phaeodactylibacter sp.]|nr:fibronectin type III domain-containing protein [Phaeodactylibacter sp.]